METQGRETLTENPPAPAAVSPAESLPQTVTVGGQEIRVFIESAPYFDALVQDIARARRRVWVEVYIFANDAGGTRIAEALKERARAGLDVRVLYDAAGSYFTPNKFFADMQAVGIKVHAFHTLWEGLRAMKLLRFINRRNHRKLIVVDDHVGYFGGMNLIDNAEPTGHEKGAIAGSSQGWRDVHVRFAGTQVSQLAESWERSWLRATGEKIPRRPRAYCRGTISGDGDAIHFFDSGWGKRYSRAARVYNSLLRRARESVWISMAYFIPVGKVLRSLLRARRRGARVRVIVPGKSDVKIVQRATAYLYARLLKRGVRFYERQERMLHSKVMVVDGIWTVVGSCNLDPRSLWLNLEFMAVIRSPALAELMINICRGEIAASKRLHLKDARGTWSDRLLNRLAWSFRWWL
jgi:cardiolipin synthase